MSDTPEWLHEPALQALLKATQDAGGQARIVGGAVRDFLLGREGGDVDVASSLLPEQTMAIAEQHQWKVIPTGIAHGTVTLVLPTRIVEVTTLRRDVTTDGRRATIAFTDDWKEDAARRDFTINALSMDAQGAIYDYFDGQKDIALQNVRFIGDAATRIAEDGLRILRFFRFLAVFGKPPADADALAAITASCGMVAALSGERVAQEMKKLLSAHNPAYAVRLMQKSGVAAHVFGRDIDPSRMIRLQMLEGQADYQTSVWARALALVPQATRVDATWLSERWKLSRHEAQQVKLLAALNEPSLILDALKEQSTSNHPHPPLPLAGGGQSAVQLFNALPRHVHTRIIRLHGAPAYLDWLLAEAAKTSGLEIAPYVHLAHDFKPPIFPITAKDLLKRGMSEGKALGEQLAALEQRWEESDYTLTKEELLS